MQKINTYKCPHCGAKYKSLQTWGNHISSVHPELIPSGWSYARYLYYILTGKRNGSCVVCKKDTNWNEATQKYERFCTDPNCKEEYRKIFKNRMMNKYGKVHLLNDPDQQRRMLANRKISGLYTFSNGKQIGYVGSYEHHFLKMLDKFLKFDPNDIMMPSPHNYEYDYKNPNDVINEGKRIFIPDAYIPSLNLEIEIKQGTNTHPKLLMIDKVKELQKDQMMKSLSDVNYIKIVDKDYTEFFNIIDTLGRNIDSNKNDHAMEATTYYEDLPATKNCVKLSSFKIGKLDKTTINAYKNNCTTLRNIKCVETTTGEIVVDGDSVVGYYQIDNRDSCNWLTAIIILPKYKNVGLEKQLFSRAIRSGKVTNIYAKISDTEFIDMCISYGFIEYSRNSEILYLVRV